MDNQKVAKQLLKVAKELVGGSSFAFYDGVRGSYMLHFYYQAAGPTMQKRELDSAIRDSEQKRSFAISRLQKLFPKLDIREMGEWGIMVYEARMSVVTQAFIDIGVGTKGKPGMPTTGEVRGELHKLGIEPF